MRVRIQDDLLILAEDEKMHYFLQEMERP